MPIQYREIAIVIKQKVVTFDDRKRQQLRKEEVISITLVLMQYWIQEAKTNKQKAKIQMDRKIHTSSMEVGLISLNTQILKV
jgi:hypothetical protein